MTISVNKVQYPQKCACLVRLIKYSQRAYVPECRIRERPLLLLSLQLCIYISHLISGVCTHRLWYDVVMTTPCVSLCVFPIQTSLRRYVPCIIFHVLLPWPPYTRGWGFSFCAPRLSHTRTHLTAPVANCERWLQSTRGYCRPRCALSHSNQQLVRKNRKSTHIYRRNIFKWWTKLLFLKKLKKMNAENEFIEDQVVAILI